MSPRVLPFARPPKPAPMKPTIEAKVDPKKCAIVITVKLPTPIR